LLIYTKVFFLQKNSKRAPYSDYVTSNACRSKTALLPICKSSQVYFNLVIKRPNSKSHREKNKITVIGTNCNYKITVQFHIAEKIEQKWLVKVQEQEGQHPLTGQRAANFRLLANQ